MTDKQKQAQGKQGNAGTGNKAMQTTSKKIFNPPTYADILYSEEIGPARVTICKVLGMWTIQLIDSRLEIERERVFYATNEDPEGYERAIKQYDATCEAAAKMYNTPRPNVKKPDFIKAI